MRTLLLPVACGLCLASSPQLQAGPPAPARNLPAATPAAAAGAAALSQTRVRATRAQPHRDCIRETGSHILPPPGKCLPGPGSVYTQKDIQATGQPNIGAALRQLDPRIH